MKYHNIDFHDKQLKDIDINDDFLKANFESNTEVDIIIDLSNNYLTEIGVIKILQYLLYTDKQSICIDVSNNQIHCIHNGFITTLINFLDKFENTRINIRDNFYSNNIQDFVFYEFIPKIIY